MTSGLTWFSQESPRIPKQGPLVVVTNRLLGVPSERIVAQALRDARPDCEVAGASLEWVRDGHAAVISNERMATLLPSIQECGARVLPLGLRRAGIGKGVEARVGKPVAASRLAGFNDSQQAGDYIRRRTQVLTERPWPSLPPLPWQRTKMWPVRAGVDQTALAREVEKLDGSHCLLRSGEFRVLLFRAQEAPEMMQEIGRLREITFRAEGEGTGLPCDLDRFDATYDHLVLWNSEKQQIAGAYRIGRVDEILRTEGPAGLYVSTLFDFHPRWWAELAPALELGRSFVALDYQRSYQPLLLLWKGIGQILVRDSRYRYLFGPVSISAQLSAQGRELIHGFFRAHRPPNVPAVRPKRPFRARPLAGWEMEALGSLLRDIDELSDVVADVEPGGAGLPVLMRQYANLGGVFIEFNVDPQFNNVLDGLVLVDLRTTEQRLLERYLGRTGAEQYLAAQHCA